MTRRGQGAAVVLAFVVPAVAILSAVVRERPYFGLFDDEVFLREHGDIFWRTVHFTRYDVGSWGMVRPFYQALAEPYYALGNHTTLGLYVANWASVVCILALLGVALRRAFRVPTERRSLFLAAYAVTCFAYPWTMFLFSYVSLQEKWLLLAGAFTLLWTGNDRAASSRLVWASVTVALLLFGFLLKAQFAVFVPVLLLFLAANPTDRRFRLTVTAATSGVALIALGLIGRHGSYTSSKWLLANVAPQLRSSFGVLFIGFAVGWLVVAIILGRRSDRDEFLRLLVPAAAMLAFLVMFLPWPQGLQSYPASIAVFSVASAAGLLAVRIPFATAWAAVTVIGLLSTGWCIYRGSDLFGRLASVGAVARAAPLESLVRSNQKIYVSCSEGGAAIASYVLRERHLVISVLPPVDVGPGMSTTSGAVPLQATAVISGRDCPATLDDSWRLIWASGHRNGLSLFERRAATP